MILTALPFGGAVFLYINIRNIPRSELKISIGVGRLEKKMYICDCKIV